MSESIEELEARKRRLELKADIAKLELKNKVGGALSEAPSAFRDLIRMLVLVAGAIGAVLLIASFFYRPTELMPAGFLFMSPLLGDLAWRLLRR